MSLFIKGMDMPKEGIYKAIIQVDKNGKGKIAVINSPFVRDYQTYDLAVIPIPHGDLIDKQVLLQDLFDCEVEMSQSGYQAKLSDAFDEVDLAIPVIQAEEKYDTSSTHAEDICSRFKTRIIGEWQ